MSIGLYKISSGETEPRLRTTNKFRFISFTKLQHKPHQLTNDNNDSATCSN